MAFSKCKYVSIFFVLAAVIIHSASSSRHDSNQDFDIGRPIRTISATISNVGAAISNLASRVHNSFAANPPSDGTSRISIPVASGGRDPPPGYVPDRNLYVPDFTPPGGFNTNPTSNNQNFQPSNSFPPPVVNNQQFPPLNSFPPPAVIRPNIRPSRPQPSIQPSQAGSFSSSAPASSPTTSVSRGGLMQVINGVKDFSLDLLSTYRAIAGYNNVLFSPVSISSLLALLTLGSSGLSKQEIEVALNIPSDVNHHEVYQSILQRMNYQSEGANVTTSSRMFIDQSISVKNTFITDAEKYYNCSVRYPNFNDRPDLAKRRINNWVYLQTNGLIRNFITDIPRHTRLILANTIYFSGAWNTPFSHTQTKEEDFNTGQKIIKIAMMKNILEVPHHYSEDLNVDVVALPYKGNQFAMVIILPREDPSVRSIKDVEMSLDSFYLDDLLQKMTNKRVSIALPKMKLELKTYMKSNLDQLSVSSIFSPITADFSGISDQKPLFVNQFIHEAVMKVDEEGTVAAAASAVSMDRIGGFVRVGVEKPAIIFIVDVTTGLPLFWSRLIEPNRL